MCKCDTRLDTRPQAEFHTTYLEHNKVLRSFRTFDVELRKECSHFSPIGGQVKEMISFSELVELNRKTSQTSSFVRRARMMSFELLLNSTNIFRFSN